MGMVFRPQIIDVETKSTLDLKKVGHERYARDPETDIRCVCGVLDNDPNIWTWLPQDPAPAQILEAIADLDVVFVAHNASFERSCGGTFWRRVTTGPRARLLSVGVARKWPRHGWHCRKNWGCWPRR
jgi:hypothetical protein